MHGFDESLIAGEEPEMSRRLRQLDWKIQHIDAPMTLHDLAITRFSQYWRRSERAGFAYASVAERYRNTSDPFWSAEVKRNKSRGLFWICTPIVAIAASDRSLVCSTCVRNFARSSLGFAVAGIVFSFGMAASMETGKLADSSAIRFPFASAANTGLYGGNCSSSEIKTRL